ncbi:HesB [Bacillus wiedmannii]|nr:HesB [Bacillus wiedmannii]PEL18826.1 HesB [Bacillus wiedmannii]PEL54948.1 HesB [Bacillus wiedmannii]PEM09987.1 HesB [Bacillus wiedmannii]PEO08213.1 HesB [Bacillus wiedmannii]
MFARFLFQCFSLPYCSCFCNNKGNIHKGWDTMNIRITDEAKAAIHRLEREDKKIIRIRGTMTNSCSIFIDVDLIWDTYDADDVVYEDAEFIVQMDSFTKDYTGDTVTLDYKTTGFSITTPSETLVYGLSIKK